MPENWEDQRNYSKKYAKHYSRSTKKPKLKMKAAKVLKFLLNFLPKSKSKGDLEKLCTYPQVPNCYTNNVDTTEFHPLLQKLNETISSSHQINKALSSSWSYLIHEQFTPNIECAQIDDVSNDIFYNESYFEDDYWLDFREQEVSYKSLDLSQNESFCRLFELERTPCGEFKRVLQEASQKRHASVPNLVAKEDFLQTQTFGESDSFLTEELLDYDKLLFNPSQFGFEIAFDNLLDESIMWNNELCSEVNEMQSTSMNVANTECSIEGLTTNDQIKRTNQDLEETTPLSLRTFTIFNNLKPKTLETSDNAAEFGQVIEVFSKKSDQNVHCPPVYVENFISKPQKVTISKAGSLQILQQLKSPSGTAKHLKLIPICKNSKQKSLEYDKSISMTPGVSLTYVQDDSTEKFTKFCPKTKTLNPNLDGAILDTAITRKISAPKLHLESSKLSNFQPVTVPTTSSPMHLTNTLSNKVLTVVPDFSPIRQNSNVLRPKPGAHNYLTCLKIKKPETSPQLMNISLRSKLNKSQPQAKVFESVSEDYNLLSRAADFILNRTGLKKELQSYISLSEVVEHLSSYFMSEISKLSNKSVQSVADYKRIIHESMDIFNSDRLTHKNCLSELLRAILSNRQGIVSKCEDFILENLHNLDLGQNDGIKASVELVFLLLCNLCITKSGSWHYREKEPDINSYIKKYLESHQDNITSYLKMKKIYFTLFNQGAVTLSNQTFENLCLVSCKEKPISKHENMVSTINTKSFRKMSACNKLGYFEKPPMTLNQTYEAFLSDVESDQTFPVTKPTFFWQSRHHKHNWNRMGPVISTMV